MAYVLKPKANAAEPVSLDMAKAHCRVTIDNEDTLFEDVYIPMARDTVEQYCGVVLVERAVTFETAIRYSEVVPLPVGPVLSIDRVSTLNSDGTTTTLDPATYVFTAVQLMDGRWAMTSQVALPPYRVLTIEYSAGYDSADIPPNLTAAMLLYIGDAYENREGQVVGTSIAVNLRAQALCDPYRVNWGL